MRKLVSKSLILGSLVLFAHLVVGCFSVTGQLTESVRESTSVVDTRTEIADSPELQRYELQASINEGELVILAERVGFCRETYIEVMETRQTVERTLPGTHWIMLGASVALLGGGGTMIGIGVDRLSVADETTLGTASQEEELDQGHVLVGAGAGVAAVGLGLGISEIVDLVLASDSSGETERREQREPGELDNECLREPASGQALSLESSSGAAWIHVDDDGVRKLPLADEPLASLVEPGEMLTVKCDGCSPVKVDVPAR